MFELRLAEPPNINPGGDSQGVKAHVADLITFADRSLSATTDHLELCSGEKAWLFTQVPSKAGVSGRGALNGNPMYLAVMPAPCSMPSLNRGTPLPPVCIAGAT